MKHPARVTPRAPRPQHHRLPPYGPGVVGSGEANVGFLLTGPGPTNSAPLNVRAAKNTRGYMGLTEPEVALPSR